MLECAAVSGSDFLLRAIVELCPPMVRDDAGRHLLALARKELVCPHAALLPGQDGFRFVHGLVRETAYAAIPKSVRAGLHERFAVWLAANAGERSMEVGEIHGFHLEQAYRYRAELGMLSAEDEALGREAARILAGAGGARCTAGTATERQTCSAGRSSSRPTTACATSCGATSQRRCAIPASSRRPSAH